MLVPPVPFDITGPGQIRFGRGAAREAGARIAAFGLRGVVVHGADAARARWLMDDLAAAGAAVQGIACATEPTLAMLDIALAVARDHRPDWVAAIGGGAALDLGKALAALAPGTTPAMDHLEVVGRGLPLSAPPLPFVALPTTAGTGSEATRNAVIGVPEAGRKVSLRDPRMVARLALVDPALTDHCPRGVTLAAGLDALTQVIEPYLSARATPYTDAICRPVIGPGLAALARLMTAEEAAARDVMAWVGLTGGLALANAGLGAVHGLAGVIGGRTGAAHGAVCGALLGPSLAVNAAHLPGGHPAAARLAELRAEIAGVLGGDPADAPQVLAQWAAGQGLPGLTALGVDPADHARIAAEAQASSSMKGNPVPLPDAALVEMMRRAG